MIVGGISWSLRGFTVLPLSDRSRPDGIANRLKSAELLDMDDAEDTDRKKRDGEIQGFGTTRSTSMLHMAYDMLSVSVCCR
jgi:hypothetical protein